MAYTPTQGLPTFADPSPTAQPGPYAPGGAYVDVVEQQAYGWTLVRFQNGWQAWVDGSQLLAEPPRPPAQNQRTILVAAGVAGVAIIALVAFLVLRSDDDSPPTAGESAEPAEGEASGAGEGDGPEESSGDAVGGGEPLDEFDEVERLFEELEFDPAGVPNAETLSPEELLGGAPDRVAAGILSDALEAEGFDLTGLGILVLPVTGTGTELMVLSTDPSTAAVNDSRDNAGEILFTTLADTLRESLPAVSQIALTYEDVDESRGPYTATLTVSVEDFLATVDTEGDLFEKMKMQLVFENEGG